MFPSTDGVWDVRPTGVWLLSAPLAVSVPVWPMELSAPRPVPAGSDSGAMFPPPPPGLQTVWMRRQLLQRSLFELVEARGGLALTDTAMLGWYLNLAPEDRRIILGEGGLQFFLQNHPNLEVLEDYVYLKYRLQQSETLKVFPGDFQNRANRSQLQLPEGVHSNSAVHLTGHSDPLTQNQSRVNSSTTATPLVMESDQSRQRGESSYWIHDPVAHHQSYASTLQTRAELQPPPPAGPTGGDLRREWEKSHSLINDDRSILMCLTSENLSMSDDKAPVHPVYDNSCNPPGVKRTAAASCCDAGLDSKPKSFTSISTQTEAPSSAEKSVMTVVLMSDLDCLSEELKRLQMPEECNETKKKSQRAKDLPAETNILQKLERDYKLLKQQLLMGIPLEQLSPLCVDPKVTPPGAGSSPAQVIGGAGENPPCLSTGQEVQRPGESGCHEERKRFQTQDESEEAADLANDGLIKQTASEEPGTDEIWFDAKEELNLPELAAEIGPNSDMADNQNAESAGDESSSSELCVSNLPGNTAETDQKQKFHPSDVSISTLKNKGRDAMVDASEAAAGREPSGHQIQNYTISISHDSGAIDGNQSSSSVSKHDAIEASPSENKPIDSPLLGSSTQRWRVVSNSLTGRKTYVPLHFGTMDSLRILMGELTRMHPDVGRQGVMDALMELKTRHGGALGSLPLSTIRDMTSDLLTKSAPATQT